MVPSSVDAVSIDLVSGWVGIRGRAAVKPSRSRLWSPMRLCRASLAAPRAGSGVSRPGGKIFDKIHPPGNNGLHVPRRLGGGTGGSTGGGTAEPPGYM